MALSQIIECQLNYSEIKFSLNSFRMRTRSSEKISRKTKRKNEINKQLVIRFPQDVADLIHDKNYDAKFSVQFQDDHNAKCQIFDEEFNAVLISLPTIVETFRTTDGYHLFKSGEISDILLVYREGEEPTGISNDYKYAHGITPPTTDIVAKRKTKQETIAITHHESFLDDVEYWDLAELQITSLMSKEKKLNRTQRKEILEEPDVDPVILEIVLRKNGYSEYKGYSGLEISQEEVDRFDMNDLEHYLSQPSQFHSSILNENSSNQTSSSIEMDSSGESDSNSDDFNEDFSKNSKKEKSITISNHLDDSKSISFDESDSNLKVSENIEAQYDLFFDENEEEEDSKEIILQQLEDKRKSLLTELDSCRLQLLVNSTNNIIQEKIKNHILTIENNIKEIEEKIRNIDEEDQ